MSFNKDDRSRTRSSGVILPVIDAVQEFKVQSHNDKAEYGGVLGGIINVVSKSGGNTLHGSAWEFLRNDFFDARNPFADAARSGPTPPRPARICRMTLAVEARRPLHTTFVRESAG